MQTLATLALGYLIAQALVLLVTALVSEWRHPSRTTRRTLVSPFTIELN